MPIKVSELIEQLKAVDPDLEVWVDCGDNYYSGAVESADLRIGEAVLHGEISSMIEGKRITYERGWRINNGVPYAGVKPDSPRKPVFIIGSE